MTPQQTVDRNAPVVGSLPNGMIYYPGPNGGTAYQTPDGKRGSVAYPPSQNIFGAVSNQFQKQVTPANGYRQ